MSEHVVEHPPVAAEAAGSTTRRQFLKVAVPAVGAAALATSGLAAIFDWHGVRTYFHWYFRGVRNYASAYRYLYLAPTERIIQHFDYLKLDEAGVRRFVSDYEKAYGKLGVKATENNRAIFGRYLLSSDFWQHGGDETRVVRYVALYDPYITPCWNPCARFTDGPRA